jgi:hypothetical protein
MNGSFSAELERGIETALGGVREAFREFCRRLFTMIVDGTPVLTGRLRGNWQCSVDDGNREFLPVRPRYEVLYEIESVLDSLADDDVVYFSNNAPYVLVIEYEGHSKKAPDGMARLAVAHARSILMQVGNEVRN